MSNGKCDICGKESIIHISNTMELCADCHNKSVLESIGMKNTYTYNNKLRFKDDYGVTHVFTIQHLILSGNVFWKATEKNSSYQIEMASSIFEKGNEAYTRFVERIKEQVNTKTIENSYLNEKGNIGITCIENHGMGFLIDGKEYTGSDLEELFSNYEGFTIHFQIMDATEKHLSKDEYLIATKIDDTLVKDLTMYLSYYKTKQITSSDLIRKLVNDIFEKLKYLFKVNREETRILADKIAKELFAFELEGYEFLSDYMEEIGEYTGEEYES